RFCVPRCRALGPLRDVERDLLAILQRFEAGSLDRAVMGEEILAAVIRRDESKALRVGEPLNGTCRHVVSIPKLLLSRDCPSPASGTIIKGRNGLPLGRPLTAIEGTYVHLLQILRTRVSHGRLRCAFWRERA